LWSIEDCSELTKPLNINQSKLYLAQENEAQCFVPGECEDSKFLRASITLGENGCLHFCKKVEGCKWFTYHPENSLCVATSDCVHLNSTADSLSGHADCSDLDNQCWVQGICQGTLITEVKLTEISNILTNIVIWVL
jgi:hypothetical protein